MKDIEYTITFYSDWHCGSGLSAGADVDLLVVKDENRLPFVPGKTMKGLVREAMMLLCQVKKLDMVEKLNETFGYFDDKDDKKCGTVFFSNAVLSENESKVIIDNNLSQFLYRKISSTAINENGIAVDHSLRKMETVVPCKVKGKISNVDDDLAELIRDSLKLIKHLGSKRTRGFGRCSIKGGIV